MTMNGIIRSIVISGFVIAFVVFSAGTIGAEEGTEAAPQPLIGTAAPGFELQGIDSDTYSLSGLKGKYVVIHFGASW
jgi:cytochrome oxidase Cu insertion factor (SCO1/SenC/PrrC family)